MKGVVFAAVLGAGVAAVQSPAAGQATAPPRAARIIAFSEDLIEPEQHAAGLAARWAAQGHQVKFVAMTNRDVLNVSSGSARQRAAEVLKCAHILGIEMEVVDIHPAELRPSRENRETVARLLRQWQPDIVLSSRPYANRAIDALLPAAIVESSVMPAPPRPRPVHLYYADNLQPPPFDPAIVAGFDDVADKKWQCIGVMPVPLPDLANITDHEWHNTLVKDWKTRGVEIANQYRERLVALYGADRGRRIRYAERFEVSQTGRPATVEELLRLFPK